MIPFLLLLAATQYQSPEVTVAAPGKPNAQTPATLVVEPAAMFIVACDADGDARTTRSEVDECVQHSFDAIDTGHTGRIGYIAFADWQTRWLGDQGALPSPFEVDRDGDDRITAAELKAQFSKLFSRFDANRDGAVTRAEALTVRATAADQHGPTNAADKGKRGRKPQHPPGEPIPGGTPEPRSIPLR